MFQPFLVVRKTNRIPPTESNRVREKAVRKEDFDDDTNDERHGIFVNNTDYKTLCVVSTKTKHAFCLISYKKDDQANTFRLS